MHLRRRMFNNIRLAAARYFNYLSYLYLIQIKHEENLPAFVCHVCLYKLNMWSEFKERFIESNKILLGQLEVSVVSDIDVSSCNIFLIS